MTSKDIYSFLQVTAPVIDVRSPGEFAKGHIQGAFNVPLLDDFERKEVGTLYKTHGMQAAFFLGLKFIGPKLSSMVETIHGLSNEKKLCIYCFRGGLRSASVANLIRNLGCEVVTLKDGYKAYRRFCIDWLNTPFQIKLIGGLSGSGKTDFLKSMRSKGAQVVDLEDIASHRGSVFGHLNLKAQPTQEHFENMIAETLRLFDPNKPVWIEDESRMIGNLKIPDFLFFNMQKAPILYLERELNERIRYLLKSYGAIPITEFISSIERIRKRLGSVRAQEIIEYAKSDKWEESLHLLLNYYDKAYGNSLKGKLIIPLNVKGVLDEISS